MFREASAIDSERTANSVRSLYAKYSADENWFTGTPDSVDRRIAQAKKIANAAKAACVRLSGRNVVSQYIALAHEMDTDRVALEGLRRDLLTAATDREDGHTAYQTGFGHTIEKTRDPGDYEGKHRVAGGISPETYEYIKNRAEGGGFAQSVGGNSPEAVIDYLLRQQEGFKGTPYYEGHHPDEMVKGWKAAQEYEDSPDYRDITDSLADQHMAGKHRVEARYFIAEQECDDLRELTIRAKHFAERVSSTLPTSQSAKYVRSFVEAVRSEYKPPRQQRTAASNYNTQDFPADFLYLE